MHTDTTSSTTLPLDQAAALLGVPPDTLRDLAATGRLRSVAGRSPRERRFRVSDLRSYLAAGGVRDARARRAVPTAHGAGRRLSDLEAQIDSIAKLGTRLNRLTTVAEIGNAICLELRQLIDYHNVRVYRVVGDSVEPVAWRGEVGVYVGEDGRQLRLGVGQGITGWVALHGEPQYLPDAAHDPRAETIPGTEVGLDESMLVAPMRYEDRTIGVIVLSKLGLDEFDPRDLRYLGIYASIAAQAMVNAEITERLHAQEEALRQQAVSQAELLRLTESILSNLDPAAVVEEIARTLGDIIGVDDLGIYVHEPSMGLLRPLIARGRRAGRLLSRALSDSTGAAAEALASGEVGAHPWDGPGDGARIIAPLRGSGRGLGVLVLVRTGAGARFEPREVELVRLFAAHVSIALTNALAHRAVELRAQTDALTGLKNHGTFGDDLRAAISRRERFAVLMIDLDDFKAFNDRCGHEAGNERLRHIAHALRVACREGDEVYRYGGDEFALILPRTGANGALEVAERVRRSVARATRGRDGETAGTRCSVGIACFPDDGRDRDALLAAADRALYAAKHGGRDRVHRAGSETGPAGPRG